MNLMVPVTRSRQISWNNEDNFSLADIDEIESQDLDGRRKEFEITAMDHEILQQKLFANVRCFPPATKSSLAKTKAIKERSAVRFIQHERIESEEF